MKRRAVFLLPGLLLAVAGEKSLRGKLAEGRKLDVGGRLVSLECDEPVGKVLDDERLIGTEFEVQGEMAGEGKFVIDGIHTKPLYTFVKGEKLGVSYWCEICYIRTYSPGKCWCCQEYTKLDPKDPNTPDRKP
jgi:hypothetical protein